MHHQNDRKILSPAAPLYVSMSTDDSVTPASSDGDDDDDSFHADLKKALSKEPKETGFDPLQRHGKPKILKGDADGAEKAIRMLQHMVRIGVATESSFQMVFRALVNRGRMQWSHNHNCDYTCAANELEVLLLELEDLEEPVSSETYNLVLEAYGNCANSRGNYRYAQKAEGLLQRMGDLATNESLLHVLRSWAWQQGNRDDSKCARTANDYLKQLEAREDVDELILSQAYDWVLEGFSKAVGGASEADAIFKKRVRMSIPVPIADYTNVILAWSKDRHEVSAEKATVHLQRMTDLFLSGELTEDPEHIAFSSVISSWTNLDEPTKAEELLWLMEKQVRPKTKNMQPSVYTYNNVCHGYIKDNSKITTQSLKSVAKIIKYMEDNWKEQPLIKPDSYTYNTFIKAWNLSGNLRTVEQMEQVLDRMELVLDSGKVSNKNFNMVLNAYAKSGEPDAAHKALKLLDRMKKSKLVDPDTITYTTVLTCLSKSSEVDFAADKASELLDEIQSIYESSPKKQHAMMPNSRTFSTAILTIAKSPGRIQEARELLNKLIVLYKETKEPSLRPTAHAYNYVINGASNVASRGADLDEKTRIAAFKIAARTYQELREHKELKPDSYTYAFWFKSCNQLLPSTSELYLKFMNLSFSQCCKEGMVSREVLNRLKQGHLDYEQLAELLGCDARNVMKQTVDDLKPVWTRNVKSYWKNGIEIF